MGYSTSTANHKFVVMIPTSHELIALYFPFSWICSRSKSEGCPEVYQPGWSKDSFERNHQSRKLEV
ncbi:hypothetical protein ACS0TY_034767 [Phlomoides rotata]